MAGDTYIEQHPNPNARQYTAPRRAVVTGGIVVHTAENATDLVPPDDGAESVARFISTRTNAGSYHTVVDSSSIIRLIPYQWEAWHDGTGSNRYSLGLSFACRASWWPELMRGSWGPAAIDNGARAAADMASWVRASTGVVVPARHISVAEFRSGRPGFVGHGELDPGRRSDPGVGFPWELFLDRFTFCTNPVTEEPDLEYFFHEIMADVDELYLAYRGHEPTPDERSAWGRDIAHKIFVTGEDIRPTLDYINHALSNEGR